MRKKIAAIIQARMGSSRLPGKVLMPLGDATVLEQVIRRCRLATSLDAIHVATSTLDVDRPIVALCESIGISVSRGSEQDVLTRYIEAARILEADATVRITADCPLIDPNVIDSVVSNYLNQSADYVHIEGYPNGLGAAELMPTKTLQVALNETSISDQYYREHVMTYITAHPEKFQINIKKAPKESYRPDLRFSVDELADLELVRRIWRHFSPRIDFNSSEIIQLMNENSELQKINEHIRQKT